VTLLGPTERVLVLFRVRVEDPYAPLHRIVVNEVGVVAQGAQV